MKLSEGFRHFVASMPAPVASGWNGWPGGACTRWKAPPFHGARGVRSLPLKLASGSMLEQPRAAGYSNR